MVSSVSPDVTLRDVADEVKRSFSTGSPRIEGIGAAAIVDSTGDEAVRFEVVLSDPPAAGGYSPDDLQPIRQEIARRVAEQGLAVYIYVEFRLASEDAALHDGTYYAD